MATHSRCLHLFSPRYSCIQPASLSRLRSRIWQSQASAVQPYGGQQSISPRPCLEELRGIAQDFSRMGWLRTCYVCHPQIVPLQSHPMGNCRTFQCLRLLPIAKCYRTRLQSRCQCWLQVCKSISLNIPTNSLRTPGEGGPFDNRWYSHPVSCTLHKLVRFTPFSYLDIHGCCHRPSQQWSSTFTSARARPIMNCLKYPRGVESDLL